MKESTEQAVPLAVGVDTARYGHHVTVLNDKLEFATAPFLVMESNAGYAHLQQMLEKLKTRHGRVHFRIRIDAAGQYATNLECFLRALPFEKTISIGEPKRNKNYRNVHFPKRKADAVESLACARFAMVEHPQATFPVPSEFLQLREILSALQSQTKRTTRLTNQLHNRLSRAFPELAALVHSVASVSVLKLLAKYPTAGKVAAARLSSLEQIPFLRADKAEAIHQSAKESTASMDGPFVECVVTQLVDELRQSKNGERKLKTTLETAYDALPPGGHLHVESISGIGKLTAAALVANIVSLDRFATPQSLVNFYGVFPEEHSSGVDRRGKPKSSGGMRMSQKGNDLIRKLLYMSCLSALKTNPVIRTLYARKRAENKRGDVALGHCMRKMLHLVYAVWKTDRPFDPNYATAAADQQSVTLSQRRQV